MGPLVFRGLASLTWHRTRWWNDSKRWQIDGPQESGWLILWFSDNSSCFFEAIISWYIIYIVYKYTIVWTDCIQCEMEIYISIYLWFGPFLVASRFRRFVLVPSHWFEVVPRNPFIFSNNPSGWRSQTMASGTSKVDAWKKNGSPFCEKWRTQWRKTRLKFSCSVCNDCNVCKEFLHCVSQGHLGCFGSSHPIRIRLSIWTWFSFFGHPDWWIGTQPDLLVNHFTGVKAQIYIMLRKSTGESMVYDVHVGS